MDDRSLIVNEASTQWHTRRPGPAPVCPTTHTHEAQDSRPKHVPDLMMKSGWTGMRRGCVVELLRRQGGY
jgi:hypothetical protein